MAIIRDFDLYLNTGISTAVVINVNQYDSGETWRFSLYTEDGQAYTPTDVAIVGTKSDGNMIANAGTVSNSKAIITETVQMTAAAGKAVFELIVDGETHGTANFLVLVEESPTENGIASDSDLSLFEQAIGGISSAHIAEAVATWMDEHLTPTTPVIDDTLTVQGAAADAKATGDAISTLQSQIASSAGLTEDIKQALMDFANAVAFKSNNPLGQTYIDALEDALYPPVDLVSISAVYTQSEPVYESSSLDSLKADLVVTAHYSDSTTGIISNYALSGVLTVGTSTITVTYGGKTTTFTVTVSERMSYSISDGSLDLEHGSISWDSTNDIYTDTSTSPTNQTTRRRNIGVLSGVKPYNNKNGNVWSTENRYPVPVPSNATKCTYAITPNTQFVGASFYTYDENTGVYTRTDDVGWKQGSYTFTFTAGSKHYMAIATKYDSSGTSYPVEVSDITITFEE